MYMHLSPLRASYLSDPKLFPQMPIHRRTCYTCGRHRPQLAQTIYRCARCLYVKNILCLHLMLTLSSLPEYCSRQCQKRMWAIHKHNCRVPTFDTISTALLHTQTGEWMKQMQPVLSRYALWALNLGKYGLEITSRV